jgi:hypothetical protein
MKQSKGTKLVKSVRLSDPTAVRDVSLGHGSQADRPPRNYAKSAHEQTHEDTTSAFDDVAARRKRWGV